ncbi:MAG TPA: ABC transporter ATP-binding protein [Chloroflexota bacterium]|nr:ABC transporter ATP-binding protein [Chloroflexota bacterium]
MLVALDQVTKRYGSATSQPALDAISLEIAAGKITAIMGPSGSGKSTLLNLIAGLDRPTSGSIAVQGKLLNGLGEGALARYRRTTVGLIFQFFNLLENLTVLDNVLVPAQLSGMNRKAARARARLLLDQLGIAALERSYPARLSGGQRQRVAVARALINKPALLMGDEPTGALDSHAGEQVLDLLQDLNRGGQTIILVTHDTRLAERYADDIVTLVDGAIANRESTAPRSIVRALS